MLGDKKVIYQHFHNYSLVYKHLSTNCLQDKKALTVTAEIIAYCISENSDVAKV